MVPTDLLQDRTVSDQPIGYLLTQAFATCNLNTNAGLVPRLLPSVCCILYDKKAQKESAYNEPK